MRSSHRIYLWSLLAALIVLTQGCTRAPEIKQPVQPEIGPQLAQAEALEAGGDYRSAAMLYRQLAKGQPSPEREELLLRAAQDLVQAGDSGAARTLLTGLDDRPLPPEFQFRKRLQLAEVAIAEANAGQALALLLQPPPGDTSLVLRQRYHQVRADAYQLAGNRLESARQLSELDRLLSDPTQRLDNQVQIIQRLASLTDLTLESLQPPPPDTFGGWMALARTLRLPPEQMQTQLADWRQQFPGHPALPGLVQRYLQTREARYQRFHQVAVLLPESGRYAGVAQALRSGLLAAFYGYSPQHRPKLRFYDSSNPAEIWPLYQRAVAEGADVIIGPLDKQVIVQLAEAGELEVPLLALNQITLQNPPTADFFQFGLAPEDEARQVAEKAWLDGYSQAGVLSPKTPWGERLWQSFRERWEGIGGLVAEHQSFDPKGNDFSVPIRRLLNLDESEERRRHLQRTLGKKLKFEPRIRRDLDFIFLAARAQNARQIRPQLQFHYASGLPVYATSHAYAGVPNQQRDQDLEGLMFPDLPWILAGEDAPGLSRAAFLQALPESEPRYSRVYAMGIDSLNLLPHLLRLSLGPEETYEGNTGILTLDQENRIHRQLMWARIVQGLPQVTGYVPRLPEGPVEPAGPEPERAPVEASPAPTDTTGERIDSRR